MDEKSLFMNFWTNESKTTRNVLARIPEGSDYRLDPKSRTAREIAWQIVCEEKMIIEALESGEAEWAGGWRFDSRPLKLKTKLFRIEAYTP